MNIIENQEFGGERPLYAVKDTALKNVTIHAGESSLKHCQNLSAEHCTFEGKYPMWHCGDFSATDCTFTPGGRAAIWYSRRMKMARCTVDAPKMFRDAEYLDIEETKFTDAKETLWNCGHVHLKNVTMANADYLFMHSHDIVIENYRQDGNYSFQYCRNIEIRNAVINSKDAFWNSENITVVDSTINGEFLGWHTKNLRLVNCKISGTQSLCYATDLVMENCSMDPDCDLVFEYSTLRADICTPITSVKNPTSGSVTCPSVGEIIIDGNVRAPNNCFIRTTK